MKQKQYIASIICLLILLIPNIACMCLSSDLTYSWIKEVGYLLVVLFLLFIPLTFLKKRTYWIVEGVLSLFWMPIEVSSLYLNHITSSPHFIRLILQTNWIEAKEVLISTWPILIVLFILWSLYGLMVAQINNDFLLPKWCRWSGLCLLIIIICSICIIQPFTFKIAKIYPYDIYFNLNELRQEEKLIHEMNKHLETFQFGLYPRNDSTEEHYILIIGESARYDHFHINGYPYSTSPNLDTISSLYCLQHLYSQANNTYPAITQLITRATLAESNKAFMEKSIVEAYQEAGFQTTWFSCQTHMDYVTRIARTCNYATEQLGGLSAQVAYDSILVYQAQQCWSTYPAPKTFFVMHCMGSHIKYNQRYPKEFECFTPSIQATDGYAILSKKNKSKVIHSYDNTILYTDYVIARAIHALQQMPGQNALIYVSDHGENLFDDERYLFAHSSYEGTTYESHVPCFIWLSDAYKTAYPEKVRSLEANLSKQVQNDIIFHSLADLGGLNAIVNPTKSIFSSTLKEQDTIRMMTGDNHIHQLIP